MSRLPAKKPSQVIRTFKHAGFILDHIEGSHYYFINSKKHTHIFSVAYHSKEMKRSTLAKTIKQSGLSLKEFLYYDP